MSALINSLKILIAKYLNASTRSINEVIVITALPYSEYAIELIEKAFQSDGLSGLTKVDFSGVDNNFDSVIVCKCVLEDRSSFVALIFDQEELYQSSSVLKIIPI